MFESLFLRNKFNCDIPREDFFLRSYGVLFSLCNDVVVKKGESERKEVIIECYVIFESDILRTHVLFNILIVVLYRAVTI